MSMEFPSSTDPYPSPGPGKYTMFFFCPFVLLNPVYFLVGGMLCWGIPEPVGYGLGLVIWLCWWWYIAGVTVRWKSKRRDVKGVESGRRED